jgi:predicted amidohydrolase
VNKYKVTLTDEQGVVIEDWSINVHKTLPKDDATFEEADVVTAEDEIEKVGCWRVFQDLGGDIGVEIEGHYQREDPNGQRKDP